MKSLSAEDALLFTLFQFFFETDSTTKGKRKVIHELRELKLKTTYLKHVNHETWCRKFMTLIYTLELITF